MYLIAESAFIRALFSGKYLEIHKARVKPREPDCDGRHAIYVSIAAVSDANGLPGYRSGSAVAIRHIIWPRVASACVTTDLARGDIETILDADDLRSSRNASGVDTNELINTQCGTAVDRSEIVVHTSGTLFTTNEIIDCSEAINYDTEKLMYCHSAFVVKENDVIDIPFGSTADKTVAQVSI